MKSTRSAQPFPPFINFVAIFTKETCYESSQNPIFFPNIMFKKKKKSASRAYRPTPASTASDTPSNTSSDLTSPSDATVTSSKDPNSVTVCKDIEEDDDTVVINPNKPQSRKRGREGREGGDESQNQDGAPDTSVLYSYAASSGADKLARQKTDAFRTNEYEAVETRDARSMHEEKVRLMESGGTNDETGEYRGMNAYAVWLSSRYSTVQVNNTRVPTFDFVDVQLYETWSRASFAIDGPPQTPPAQYLVELVRSFASGWSVDFSSDPTVGVPTQNVSIPPQQLVLGFSRGSENGSGKSVFIWPKDVGEAFAALAEDERPLGVMFWNMEIDGRRDHGTGVNGTNVTCDQAAEFNKFLRVRT